MNIEPTELLNALKHEPPQPDAPAKPIADKDALPRTDQKRDFRSDLLSHFLSHYET